MDSKLSKLVRESACELNGDVGEYRAVLDVIGDAKVVLLGEATHGTREFYEHRSEITKHLVQRFGFSAVAVEADWPDAYRVNRFVQHVGHDGTAQEALSDFQRFPTWMWRNVEVSQFIDWLRYYNSPLSRQDRVGFYGLDFYSLYASMAAVLLYLEQVDPEAAEVARKRYECFGGFAGDPQAYGFAAMAGITEKCEQRAIDQLVELEAKRYEYLKLNGLVKSDQQFCAEQNARVVCNAEEYYRVMFHELNNTWNMRDTHMFETLDALRKHLETTRKRECKIVVWEHNSHIGDARASEMGRRGELNVGQLTRQAYGKDVRSIGFTTSTGMVAAASFWNGPVLKKTIRPPHPDSYESIFSGAGLAQFFLALDAKSEVGKALSKKRLERAIGVIYAPETERYSHYFSANIVEQFDAIIHIEESQAVRPLEAVAQATKELPETFPSGI